MPLNSLADLERRIRRLEMEADQSRHKFVIPERKADTTPPLHQVDHGALTGLADDDHTQYLNTTRHDVTGRHTLGTIVPHDDHGALTGLADDDHPQYVKDAGTVTDNAIVRYNGTDGRTIQNSGATIDDNNNLSTAGTLIANRGTDGEVLLQPSSLEIGRDDRTAAGAAYINFHSSAGSPDYDTRIVSTGGTTTAGQGTLTYYAVYHRFDNDIYYKSAVLGGWQAYTPTWTASTTNPAIGNGTLTGRYTQLGKTCIGSIWLLMGSTTTYGSGAWALGLPFTAANAGVRYSGTWIIIDPGVANYSGTLFIIPDQNKIGVFVRDGYSNYFSSTVPYTWGSGDHLGLSFTYEIA